VLAEQVAHLEADVIQLDEANLPGHPEEWPWAASAINRVLDAVETTPAVHLCFGNYGCQGVQQGTWAKLIDYLNALHVDPVVMECAHRPADELARSRSCGRRSASASAWSPMARRRTKSAARPRGRHSCGLQ
jgi:5-methyltetrahydropteroyltriglutamate--homocysteine methyltransferase